jgi:hypothetical protein
MRQQYGERVNQVGDRKQYEALKAEVKKLEHLLKEKTLREKEESKSGDSQPEDD